MKKEEQARVNAMVLEAMNEFNKTPIRVVSTARLRRCKAIVIEIDDYIILRSYKTMVAFIDKRTGVLYDVLRLAYGYTATSAQHIAKFAHDYEHNAKMTYYPV